MKIKQLNILLMMLFPALLWGQEQPSSPGIVNGNETAEATTSELPVAKGNNFLLTSEAIKASDRADGGIEPSSAAQQAEEPDQTVDKATQVVKPDSNAQLAKKTKRSLRRRNARRSNRGSRGRQERGNKANKNPPPAQLVEIARYESALGIVPTLVNSDTERLLDALADEATAEIESMTVLHKSAQGQPKEQLKPDIKVEPIIQKIELMPQVDGMAAPVQLVDSAPLVSGDRLLFTLRCSNQGAAAAARTVITYPVPPNVVYSQDSATGEQTMVLYSIDGGYSFAQIEHLQVGKKGRTVTPASDDITHVRWVHNVAFEVGQTSVLTFEGVFK